MIILDIGLTKACLCIDDELVELQFLQFFLFHHKFSLHVLKLLAESLNLFLKIQFHFVLFRLQQLIELKLTIKFLLKIFYHVTHLSGITLEFIILNFHLSHLLYGPFVLLL